MASSVFAAAPRVSPAPVMLVLVLGLINQGSNVGSNWTCLAWLAGATFRLGQRVDALPRWRYAVSRPR